MSKTDRLSGAAEMADGRIEIRYSARQNLNTIRGGWAPDVRVNGRIAISPYHHAGLDRDEALAMALAEANDEASRYVGDWTVSVELAE